MWFARMSVTGTGFWTRNGALGALVAALAVPVIAQSAPVDGNADLMCATLRTVECGPTAECLEGQAEDVNAPVFFHVNVAEGAIRAEHPDGRVVDTPIQAKTVLDDRIILQGVQSMRGWSATLDTATGRIVITIADLDASFGVFGACTNLR